MNIEKFYTKKISVERMSPIADTNKEVLSEVSDLNGTPCRIEAYGEEFVMLDDGAFYKLFKMFCGIVDIRIGDKITDEEGNEYWVKGRNDFSRYSAIDTMGGSHHLEILLALPK